MANKITWADKVALQEKPDVVAENKVTAADMNQIKTAVNETIDTMPSNLKNGIAEGSVRTVSSAEESDSYKLGKYAFAEGQGTKASGDGSHAKGNFTTASGNYSHAEGSYTIARGWGSHAEGGGTTASGPESHAEGNNTTASGEVSHVEGNNTKAVGNASHAEGRGTIANGDSSHAQGRYNIEDTGAEYAHIVGNGEYSTADDKRSNAHTLDWSGNAWFAGDVYTGSTSGTNKDDGSVKLPVVYSGTTAPSNDLGKDGDLYVLLDS